MTADELLARFPEIPRDLRGEPVVGRFAAAFDGLLRRARQPSACSREHDAANHLYLALVGPLAIYGYGLAAREDVLGELGRLLARYEADPAGTEASLVPPDAAPGEVRGPGCG